MKGGERRSGNLVVRKVVQGKVKISEDGAILKVEVVGVGIVVLENGMNFTMCGDT